MTIIYAQLLYIIVACAMFVQIQLWLFSDALSWKIPDIFSWLQKEGNLSEEEMTRTFNCGIGAVLVVQKALAGQVLKDIQRHEDAWLIGKVVHHQAGGCSAELLSPGYHLQDCLFAHNVLTGLVTVVLREQLCVRYNSGVPIGGQKNTGVCRILI